MASFIVTREELYRQVWETPMIHLAARNGLSGNGLAKICDRLDIPYPPRGYWTRRAAGQKVITYRLPPLKAGAPNQVEITPTTPKPEAAPPDVELMNQLTRIHDAIASSELAPRRRPYPIVQNWVRDRGHAIRNYKRSKPQYGPEPQPFTDTDDRMHTVLGELLWTLEKAGCKLSDKGGSNIECIVNGEPILFQLREKSRLVRLQTPPGKKADDYYHPRTELKLTGILVLSIKTRLPANLRHDWSEKGGKTMDDLVPEIAAVLISAGPMLGEARRQREEMARLQREEDQRRYTEQCRRKADHNRWRRFLEHAARHREAELARSFLDALQRKGFAPDLKINGQSVVEWVRWAEDWIEGHDSVRRGPEWVFGDVAGVADWTYGAD